MGNVLREYTIQFLKKHDRAKKLLSLFLCLSIFVSSGVLWQLKMIAVAADDSELGICYETNHGDSTVVVSKKWEDGSINHTSESSSFALYFNDTLINGEKDDTKTLSASNNWTVIFENMPDGDYRIEEIDTTTNSEEYSVEVLPTFITINPANPSTVIWSLVENNTLEPENVYLLATNQEGENKFFLGAALTDNEVITDFENVSAEYQWEYTADFNLRNLSIEEENCYLGLVFEDESPVWTFVNQEEANFFTFTENGTLSVANMEEDGTLVPVEGADVNVISSEVIENEEQEVRFYVSEIYKCNEIPGDPTGNTYDLVMFGSVVTASEQEDIPTVSVEDEQVVEAVENDVVIDEQETDPTEEVAVVEENETDATTIEVLDEVETVDENNNIASVEETTTTDVEITENNNNEVIAEDEINVIDGNITVEVIWKNDLGVEINPVYDVTIELHQIATCAAYGTSLNQVVATGKISAKDEAQEVVFDSLPLSANINGFDYEYSYYVVETYSDCEYACYLDDSTTVVDMDNAIVPAEDIRITVVNTYEEEVIIPFVLPTEEITSEEIGAPVVQAAGDGHWELETGNLVVGEEYLIVAYDNGNRIVHNSGGQYKRPIISNNLTLDLSSTSKNDYVNYLFKWDEYGWFTYGDYYFEANVFENSGKDEAYFDFVSERNSITGGNAKSFVITNDNGVRQVEQTVNGKQAWLRADYGGTSATVTRDDTKTYKFQFYKFVSNDSDFSYTPKVTPGVTAGVDFNKSIDQETELVGNDYYRLYLDVASNIKPSTSVLSEPVDLVLVIDQSWSMNNYNIIYNGTSMPRYQALENILLGGTYNGGFIDAFLNANVGNQLAIVGFDGSRFISRNRIPSTEDEFSKSYGDLVYEFNPYLNGNNPIYIGYNNGNSYYDINDVLRRWNLTYDYTLDSQEIQSWTTKNGFSGESIRAKIGPTVYSGTNYEAGLMRTLEVLNQQKNNGHKKVVIFMSDGVPTCYIYGDNNQYRGGTTLDKSNGEFLPNVKDCVNPSLEAFDDFTNAIEQSGMDVTFNAIAISSDIDEYDSVLSKYLYGEGAQYVQADTEVETLYAALMDMAVYNQSVKPDNIVIEDTLSAYVKLADVSDIQITMEMDGKTVVLYDETNKVTKDGYGIVQSVNVEDVNVTGDNGAYATKKITAKFIPNYVLVPGAQYTLSYNVQVTDRAYEEYYSSDKGYTNVGASGTNHSSDATSEGEFGFNSNEKATVTYDDGEGGNTDTGTFPHPVIQLDLATITVEKKWVDSITKDEIPANQIPSDSVTVQLYQVPTEYASSNTSGSWQQVTELTDGESYLIVALHHGNELLHKTEDWDNTRPIIGQTGGKVFDPANNDYDAYKNYLFTYTDGNFIWERSKEYMAANAMWPDGDTDYHLGYFEFLDHSTGTYQVEFYGENHNARIGQKYNNTTLWLRVYGNYNNVQVGHTNADNASYFLFYKFVPGSNSNNNGSGGNKVTPTPYGDPVTLGTTKDYGWTYTFKNLPKSEIKNGVYYEYTYYVVEVSAPYEHQIVASNPDGFVEGNPTMVNGTFTISNEVDRSFTLPNTGGVGIYNNILCGLLIIGGGLFFGVKTKKRERRQSSA